MTVSAALDEVFEAAARRHRAGDLGAAEAGYRAVLAQAPDDLRANFNLGVLLLRTGRPELALPCLERALAAEPARPASWLRYLEAMIAAQRPAEALTICEQLRQRGLAGAELDGLEARARLDAGFAATVAGRAEAAEALYRQATGLAPANADAWAALGASLMQLRRNAEAETALRESLALAPAHEAAAVNLATLLRNLGRADEARAVLAPLAAEDPRLSVQVPAHLSLSAVPGSGAEIEAERKAYAEGIDRLRATPTPFAYERGFPLPSFQLAYHGLDDRPLMAAQAQMFRAKVADLSYVSPRLEHWSPPRGPAKVLFVSDLFNDTTIGQLYRAVIRDLDRRRFAVTVVHGPGSKRDAFRDALDRGADAVVQLPPDLPGQHQAIEALAPDILFFPDVGMTVESYLLAHARLAPIQAVGWGHPDTTGLPTLDYFVSTDRFETPEADAHYAETLIRLGRNPCVYEPPEPPRDLPGREALGLPAKGRLYGCPQTLVKMHPDFDAVLAGLAEADPEGRIVIPEAVNAAWTEALQARWRRTHPVLLDRVSLVPRIPREHFVAQLAHFDLLLDPLHFGSGFTFYLAMIWGVPTVTLPGAFARSRVVAGLYDQMGVGRELIADSPDDYVARAVALAADPGRLKPLRADLRAAAEARLFGDTAAVRELEAFFSAALTAAGEGRRLGRDWRP